MRLLSCLSLMLKISILKHTFISILDLDSIDAVDLVVHLQNVTVRRSKPEEFKAVRTVNDVVESVVESILKDA